MHTGPGGGGGARSRRSGKEGRIIDVRALIRVHRTGEGRIGCLVSRGLSSRCCSLRRDVRRRWSVGRRLPKAVPDHVSHRSGRNLGKAKAEEICVRQIDLKTLRIRVRSTSYPYLCHTSHPL